MDQSPVEAQGRDVAAPMRATWRAKLGPNPGPTSPVEARPVLTIDRSTLIVDRGPHVSDYDPLTIDRSALTVNQTLMTVTQELWSHLSAAV